MADQTITPSTLDTSADLVTYDLGKANWAPAWVPDLVAGGSATTPLTATQRIDIVILGDGYDDRAEFEDRLEAWLRGFFRVEVYERFRGAFRIRAVFHRSAERVTPERKSFYRVLGHSDDGRLSDAGGWYNDDSASDRQFRARIQEDMDRLGVNASRYPSNLDVSAGGRVIHNDLANMFSNCVVCMLARTPGSTNASGFTRAVNLSRSRVINVAFGASAIHEFGHAFAYLEDEYINGRSRSATRRNPDVPSIFTLSNLSFSDRIDEVPWPHLSPWGLFQRQASGDEPSPVVGWAWLGGEHGRGVWHSEYQCLMNGSHDNYLFTRIESEDPTAQSDGTYENETGAGLRSSRRYCLWCQEIVTARILEKTGQLAASDDPQDVNERGVRWHERWLSIWRPRYWRFFDVDQQIADREAHYADMTNFPDLAANNLELWRSDLYAPFAAVPRRAARADAGTDDLELLMANV